MKKQCGYKLFLILNDSISFQNLFLFCCLFLEYSYTLPFQSETGKNNIPTFDQIPSEIKCAPFTTFTCF